MSLISNVSSVICSKGLFMAIAPKKKRHYSERYIAKMEKEDDNDLKDEFVNAGILAGLALFTALYVSNDTWLAIKIALIQGGIAFFTRLATIRGLKSK